MKKLIYLLMIAAVVLTSCKKNTTEVTPQGDNLQEVEFNITSILNSTDRALEIPICNGDLSADYAEIWLDGFTEPFFAGVYPIGDSLYTKAIMMAPGTYTLKEFYVWDDGGSAGYDGLPEQTNPGAGFGDRADDLLYKAAPMHFETDGTTETEYWQFVKNKVDQTFEVFPFLKTKIYIDVLCYVPHQWYGFGFFWFNITEITIREMCFFGDICLKDIDDYRNSWYEGQSTGLRLDMPAIFMIKVYHTLEGHTEELVGTYDNQYHDDGSLWLGEGAPLCFRYADYDKFTDSYRFELWVYVADGDQDGGFGYVKFGELAFDDEVPAENVGDDGIVDFVLGNCLHLPGDDVWVINPYMNLPDQATIYHQNPGTSGAYFGIWFDDFGGGYDIKEDTEYAGWCGDGYHYINPSGYTALIRSTLDDEAAALVPHLTPRKLECLNYMFNGYSSNGINLMANIFTPETQEEVQHSIWSLVHSSGNVPLNPSTKPPGWLGADIFPLNSDAVSMAQTALSDCPTGYVPLPGGWAGILGIEMVNDVYVGQVILVLVDP